MDVEDRVGELGQGVRATFEHVGGYQLVDGADGGPEDAGADRGDLGDVGARPTVYRRELGREALLNDAAPGGPPGRRRGP